MNKTLQRIKKKLNILIRSSYNFVKLMSFANYCACRDESELTVIANNRKGYVYPIFFWGDDQRPEKIDVILPPTYCAKINNAKIIGQSSVVMTSDGYLLYDILTDKEKSNINVTDNGLLLLSNRVVHFKNLYITTYTSKGDNIKSGIWLGGNFSDNFYHYIVEYLPKFELLNHCAIDKSVPLLVDEYFYFVPQMKTLFDIFNGIGRDIIIIKRGEIHNVENLYILSSVNDIAPNRKNVLLGSNRDFCVEENSIRYLRDSVFQYFKIDNLNYPTFKIYLSRSNVKRRHCNEDDFLPILEKMGFITLYPEKLSFVQQLYYFSNAAYIISPTGAALTNLIFVNPACKILVLQRVRKDIPIFTNLIGMLGNDIRYMVSNSKEDNKTNVDFVVSVSELESFLHFWFPEI